MQKMSNAAIVLPGTGSWTANLPLLCCEQEPAEFVSEAGVLQGPGDWKLTNVTNLSVS